MRLSRRALLFSAGSTIAEPIAGPVRAEPTEIVCPLAAAPTILIPGVSDSFATRFVGGKIYRGLLRWDGAGVLQPDLAEAIETSPDSLTYTVHLRPGVTWHDSGAFGASDVRFSLTRFHRALQPRLRLDQVTVATPDPHTVVLTLPASDPFFLERLDALSLPIVPEHVHDRADWGLDPRQVMPVGTGPFRFDSWLRLVRFDWYTGAKSALGAIECPITPDARARSSLVQAGSGVLLAGDAVDLSSIPRLRLMPEVSVGAEYPASMRAIAGLRLNPIAKPLDQQLVRLALACAVSRPTMLREAWSGLGQVASGPIVSGSDVEAALPDYSPRTAAAYLNQAGLRPGDNGIRATLTYLHPSVAPWSTLLPPLRLAFGQVGIDLAEEAVSVSDWVRRSSAGDFQVTGFVAAQTGDPATDLARYAAELPEMRALLTDGDPGLREAQALLVAKMAALWIVQPGVPVVRDKRLQFPGGVMGSFAEASLG